MKEMIRRTKWPDLASDVELATKWMQDMGLRSQHSRIKAYAKKIQQLCQGASPSNISIQEFTRRVELAYEVQQIPRIYRAFAGKETPGLRRRLSEFLSGPLLGTQENSGNAGNLARNTGFELSLGALLTEAGLDVEFPVDTDAADLIATFQGVRLLIECKRPQTMAAVGPRLHDGLKQIVRRYDRFDSTLKVTLELVALSLGKAFNPDMQLLPVSQAWLLKRRAEELGDNIWSCYQNEWIDSRHPSTIGVILNLDFPSVVESERLITYCADTILTNTPSARLQDVEFLRKLAAAVHVVLQP